MIKRIEYIFNYVFFNWKIVKQRKLIQSRELERIAHNLYSCRCIDLVEYRRLMDQAHEIRLDF